MSVDAPGDGGPPADPSPPLGTDGPAERPEAGADPTPLDLSLRGLIELLDQFATEPASIPRDAVWRDGRRMVRRDGRWWCVMDTTKLNRSMWEITRMAIRGRIDRTPGIDRLRRMHFREGGLGGLTVPFVRRIIADLAESLGATPEEAGRMTVAEAVARLAPSGSRPAPPPGPADRPEGEPAAGAATSGTPAPSVPPEGDQARPPAGPDRTPLVDRQPADTPDESAIADTLVALGYHLEAVFVRHFKGRKSTTWQDLVEAVCPGEERDWATVRTWVNRVKNALLELNPPCRLSFHTTNRGYLILKDLPPE
jgi:hypothetical protein